MSRAARFRLGGLLLLLALLYFAGEAWAAAGWEGVRYDWTRDAISELGVPEVRDWAGETFASTLHTVMNVTFVGTGVRALLAGVTLAPFVPRRARRTVLTLVAAHGLGLIVVGLFPADVGGTRAEMHGVGATLAIMGGTALLLALTVSLWSAHRRLALLTLACAVVSTAGTAGIVMQLGGFGLVERISVYAVVAWQVLAGAVLLLARVPEDSVAAGSVDVVEG